MRFFAQLKLVLWKNFTLRKRQHLRNLIELLWPLLLFLILVGVRTKRVPEHRTNALYRPRALPSAGLFVFLQSFICDFKNSEIDPEHSDLVSNGLPNVSGSGLLRLFMDAGPLLTNSSFRNRLLRLSTDYQKWAQDNQALNQLLNGGDSSLTTMNFSDVPLNRLLKDPAEFRQFLLNTTKLDPSLVTQLMNSKVDVKKVMAVFQPLDWGSPSEGMDFYKLLSSANSQQQIWMLWLFKNYNSLQQSGWNLTGSDMRMILCDPFSPMKLQRILIPPNGQSLKKVDEALCDLSNPDLMKLGNELRRQLKWPNATDLPSGVNRTMYRQLQTALSEDLQNLSVDLAALQDLNRVVNDYVALRRTLRDRKGWHETLCNQASVVRENGGQRSWQELGAGAVNDLMNGNNQEEDKDKEDSEESGKHDTDPPCDQIVRDYYGGYKERLVNKSHGEDSCSVIAPHNRVDCGWPGISESQCRQMDCCFDDSVEHTRFCFFKVEAAECGCLFNRLVRGFGGVSGNPGKGRSDSGFVQLSSLFLRGKILFTPDNKVTRRIVSEVKNQFSDLSRIESFAEWWVSNQESIRRALNSTDREAVSRSLQQLQLLGSLPDFQNSSFNDIFDSALNIYNASRSDVTNSSDPVANVTALLDSIDSTFRQFIELYKCSSHEYFEGYPDEKSLENRAVNESALPVIASLVFENVDNGLPKFVKYKIRQDIDYTPRTDQIRYRYWRPGPRDGFSANRYLNFGFMYLQDLIDRSLMNFMLNETVLEPGLYMQELPYPCYIKDRFVWYLSAMLPMFMTLAWVFSVAMVVKGIVYEKEKRLKEVMKVMGMRTSVHWLAWFINSCSLMIVSVLMLTALLKWGRLLQYSNPLIIFMFLVVFMIATVSMCFLISVFFSRANLAAACGGIIFFVTYLPYVLVRWFEMFMNTSDKAVACLSSTTAFGIACSYLSRLEAQGVGAQWSNLYTSPMSDDGFSLGFALGMMMIDAVIYGLLTWYIEAVMPGQYGIPRPWYFPFLKSYWFEDASSRGARSHVQYDARDGQVSVGQGRSHGDSSAGLEEVFFKREAAQGLALEKEPVHLPLGVSIQNLVKIYSQENKLAVDGLSLNLYENQITSFLGHNGAGKTTTMSVLSGLFPPTAGTALINGHDIRTDMDAIRRSLGICPQYNVLFDYMSVEEHLYYYASLKGMAKENIPAEIESFLNDVGLANKRHELARNLSGGMKRKLSVAMAFVAGSKVVILDEPTAGVDPYARRGIWDLLLQYKEGRTVLLSTHHMDEADVLGDRIAIISQGKLQCCGTSLFLKSHYGNGYYVTLTKKAPEDRPNTAKSLREVTLKVKDTSGGSQASSCDEGLGLDSVDASERGSIDSLPLEQNPDPFSPDTEMHCSEATVTSFIKSFIPSAQLVEHIGSDMTYVLPAEAAQEGRFQDLFEELDRNLGKLHIGTYGVSDTTLEEVFLKVAADSNAEEEDQMAAEVPKRRPSFRGRMQFRRTRIASAISDTVQLLNEEDEDELDGSDVGPDGTRRNFSDFDTDKRLSGIFLFKHQFWALLLKRFHHSRRSRKAFLSQILLPAIFVCLAMIVSQIRPFSEMPAIELSTKMFVENEPYESHVFFSIDDPRSAEAKSMSNMLMEYPGIGTQCLEDASCRRNLRVKFNKARPLYVNSTKDCDCTTGVSVCPAGAAGPSPPEWTSHTKDILQDLTGRNINDYLLKTYSSFIKKRYGGVSFGDNFKNLPNYYAQTNSEAVKRFITEHNAKVWYNNKGYHAMPTFLSVLNNAILRSKAQAKGLNASEFGIRAVNHPMIYNREQLNNDTVFKKVIDVLVAICVVFAMCFVPSSFVVFLVNERVNKAKHLHLVSGVRPYIYWLANYVWDMGNYIIPAVLCCFIFLAFGEDSYTSSANFPPCFLLLLLYGWAITPLMYPASYLFEVPSTAYIVLICTNLFIGINTTLTTFILEFFQDDKDLIAINDFLKKIFLIFPNYCLGRGLIDLAKNQFLTLFSRFGENLFRDPFSWDITGRNILAMFIQGFVFFIFTVLIEYKFFIHPRRATVAQKPDPDEDEDVVQERVRVNRGDGRITDALRLESLTKVYKSRQVTNVAVNGLCVGVPRGECFGLLGVNGAGKTTTFKMLTGDIPVTSGGAYVMGHSILTSIHDAHQAMGYCPQFDGLDDMLTATEHLQLYARLRGVPEADVKHVVDSLIRKMNLVQYQHRCAGGYSGGNKRKLSTAIALVGNPPMVFLDEPTTGMDPKARRFLWNIILSIVKEGRTVILTSHSMEECEALCSRVAIMVNGQFKCLGSPQHLKNKYGDGYTVTMRMAGTNPNLDAVCELMSSLFPGSVLKEKHHNSLEYQLPSGGLRLCSVFGHLEANRKIFDIEDYSVSQTTLDQVFINFAKNQKDAMDRENRSAENSAADRNTSTAGDSAGNYVRMVDVPLGEISV